MRYASVVKVIFVVVLLVVSAISGFIDTADASERNMTGVVVDYELLDYGYHFSITDAGEVWEHYHPNGTWTLRATCPNTEDVFIGYEATSHNDHFLFTDSGELWFFSGENGQ